MSEKRHGYVCISDSLIEIYLCKIDYQLLADSHSCNDIRMIQLYSGIRIRKGILDRRRLAGIHQCLQKMQGYQLISQRSGMVYHRIVGYSY